MEKMPVYKILIAAGVVLIAASILWYFISNKLHWLGSLPGDIRIERSGFKFYFPLTTMLLCSLIIHIIIRLISCLVK
jgi:hypothetical protein